jgi:hypothetical protein
MTSDREPRPADRSHHGPVRLIFDFSSERAGSNSRRRVSTLRAVARLYGETTAIAADCFRTACYLG